MWIHNFLPFNSVNCFTPYCFNSAQKFFESMSDCFSWHEIIIFLMFLNIKNIFFIIIIPTRTSVLSRAIHKRRHHFWPPTPSSSLLQIRKKVKLSFANPPPLLIDDVFYERPLRKISCKKNCGEKKGLFNWRHQIFRI